MTNSPIKPAHTASDFIVPLRKSDLRPSAKESAAPLQTTGEAATLALPRAASGQAPSGNPVGSVQSLVESIRNSTDASAAHGGLDASRVFDLLNDSDE